MTPDLPPLVIDPQALSLEHHLLRVLTQASPTTLFEAVGRVRAPHRFPDFPTLGTKEMPSAAAMNAWARIARESWTTFMRQGRCTGYALTPAGEQRLRLLWHLEVISPYLRRVAAEHGPAAAREAARLHCYAPESQGGC